MRTRYTWVLVSKPAILAALAALSMTANQAFSQDLREEPRIRKMEAEIRALQRNVFPGGEGKIFTPEIQSAPSRAIVAGRPATTATTDLLVRMEAVESQLARLSTQLEQTHRRISQLQERIVLARETSGANAASGTDANQSAPSANALSADADAASETAPTPPSALRLAAVRAIVKPLTNDAGDDDYSYGFRLWQAKLYPEAQQQLKLVVSKYPNHHRISFARNLLGRAFLDDDKPREAASWFLENYQSGKSGARAPDSLLFLAESMFQLKDHKRACVALAEFGITYAVEAVTRLKPLYDATRRKLECKGI